MDRGADRLARGPVVIALAVGLGLLVGFGGLVVALLAVADARRSRRLVRAAHLATAAAASHAADEAAGKETALRLLEETRILRRAEFDEFSTKVAALRWAYDHEIGKYRAALRDKVARVPPHLIN